MTGPLLKGLGIDKFQMGRAVVCRAFKIYRGSRCPNPTPRPSDIFVSLSTSMEPNGSVLLAPGRQLILRTCYKPTSRGRSSIAAVPVR